MTAQRVAAEFYNRSLGGWARPIGLGAVCLVTYLVFRTLTIEISKQQFVSPFWWVLILFLFGVVARKATFDRMWAPVTVLVRGILVMVAFQIGCEAFGAVYGAPNFFFDEGGDLLFFRYGALLALIASLFIWWRPSFAPCVLAHYVMFRHRFSANAQIPIVETDYLSMLDIGMFLALAYFVVEGMSSSRANGATSGPAAKDRGTIDLPAWQLIWGTAVGAHLGNYFWSGISKLRAGDWTLAWAFENPTRTAILIGLERGDNPFGATPQLLQLVWDAITLLTPILNPVVLGFQVLVLFACVSRKSLLTFTVFFDLFHVAVYFTLGAIFQFWVLVNALIFASVMKMRKEDFNFAIQVPMAIFTVAGVALFYTSFLGWMDGAKLAAPNVYAETRKGERVLVPAVFYGLFSYSLNQTKSYIPDNHFKMRVGGNTHNMAEFREAQACGPEVIPHQDTKVSKEAIVSLVQGADTFMRNHPQVKEHNLYYIYPHHMLANPWMFPSFNRLKMDDIVRYYYVVDSVCLSLENGRLKRDVKKRWAMPIEPTRASM